MADVPIVDIQSVWRYYVGIVGGGTIERDRHFPNIRLPFPEMIVQWSPPGWPVPLRVDLRGDATSVTVHWSWNDIADADFTVPIDSSGLPLMDVGKFRIRMSDGKPPTSKDYEYVRSTVALAFAGVNFMHVKGAVIEAPPRSGLLSSKKHRSRSLQKIHTLRIEPLDRFLREYDRAVERGVRIHVVRGHFKDFRHGAGIGGNPKARGIYWTPAHMRGDRKLGIVAKDYETGTVAPA